MSESLNARTGTCANHGEAGFCNLILIGPRGRVGGAFRHLLARQQASIARREGIWLRLTATFDRHGFAERESGLDMLDLAFSMQSRKEGDTRHYWDRIANPATSTVIVDCSASDEIADLYEAWLSQGFGIVTANKRANARDLVYYQRLQALAESNKVPYRYETTVGAAIPLLGPLRDMRVRGEKVHSMQGVLSGSLSYILHRVHQDCAFSGAVCEARQKGFTEPNPLEDLKAIDLSRKLLIIAREAGFGLELDDLSVTALSDVADCDSAALETALRLEDDVWRVRVARARNANERLVVLAEVDRRGGRVALASVPDSSPFAKLQPGQNMVSILTDLQPSIPLCVSGQGAGIDITAAGLLSDVISAAVRWNQPYSRREAGD